MKTAILRYLLFVLVVSSLLPAKTQSGACGTWTSVPSPAPSGRSQLNAVAQVSAQDVWAVGHQFAASGVFQTLAEHWDGTSWSIVPTLNTGNSDNILSGVVAFASNNVWAVGFSSTFGSPQGLVEHWDGSSWQIVPTPTVVGGSSLSAVAAISSSDIWAVGDRAVGAPGPTVGTLTMHWDGSSWSIVSSPNTANRSDVLVGVSAVASNDVWAVGTSRNSGGPYTTSAFHWDGYSWSVVTTPNAGAFTQLSATAAVNSNDVWATGVGADANVNAIPFFLHWNGTSWNEIPSPGGVQLFLGGRNGLVVVSANDIWSVGDTITHWNGTTWSLVPGAPGADGSELFGIAKIDKCEFWAVGRSGMSPVIEHFVPRRSTLPRP